MQDADTKTIFRGEDVRARRRSGADVKDAGDAGGDNPWAGGACGPQGFQDTRATFLQCELPVERSGGVQV